jgi:hypothetical protein
MPGQGYCRAEGYIKNFNTIEEYRNVDRAKVLQLAAQTVHDSIPNHLENQANNNRYGTRYTMKQYIPAPPYYAHSTLYPLRTSRNTNSHTTSPSPPYIQIRHGNWSKERSQRDSHRRRRPCSWTQYRRGSTVWTRGSMASFLRSVYIGTTCPNGRVKRGRTHGPRRHKLPVCTKSSASTGL